MKLRLNRLLESFSIRTFRRRLASIDSTAHFAILGIASGIVTGMVVLAFRKLIEMPLSELLPGGPDNFEGLHWSMYFLFPFTGGIVLAILFSIIDTNSRRVGVVHVLERLARHQGHLQIGRASGRERV